MTANQLFSSRCCGKIKDLGANTELIRPSWSIFLFYGYNLPKISVITGGDRNLGSFTHHEIKG